MPYYDLREFLSRLEREGELIRVKVEVDLKYEMGAICRKALDSGGVEANKALLFEKPKGYQIPVAAGLLDARRRYFLATETTPENFGEEFEKRTARPIEPRLVKDGPCKENVLIGEKANLYDFPIPTFNEKDGGPYITMGAVIYKNPDTGSRNVGIYRLMIHDSRSTGLCAPPFREVSQFARKVHARGEALPVAIVVGMDPAIYFGAISAFPYGVDELAMAGAMRGEPVDIVRCETIPLEVPATAEIVIEGEIRPNDTKLEGPFGEFTGYYGEALERPVIRVKAITHRDQPIFQACYQGRPPNCDSVTRVIPHEAEIMKAARALGLKKINICVGSALFTAIASIEKKFGGQERWIAAAILGTHSGRTIKTLILVDDDIDPYNWEEVEWALGTRFQPQSDIEVIGNITGVNLDPSLPEYERETKAYRTSKLIIDATKPVHVPFAAECLPKKDVMEMVEANWERYGIDLGS